MGNRRVGRPAEERPTGQARLDVEAITLLKMLAGLSLTSVTEFSRTCLLPLLRREYDKMLAEKKAVSK